MISAMDMHWWFPWAGGIYIVGDLFCFFFGDLLLFETSFFLLWIPLIAGDLFFSSLETSYCWRHFFSSLETSYCWRPLLFLLWRTLIVGDLFFSSLETFYCWRPLLLWRPLIVGDLFFSSLETSYCWRPLLFFFRDLLLLETSSCFSQGCGCEVPGEEEGVGPEAGGQELRTGGRQQQTPVRDQFSENWGGVSEEPTAQTQHLLCHTCWQRYLIPILTHICCMG